MEYTQRTFENTVRDIVRMGGTGEEIIDSIAAVARIARLAYGNLRGGWSFPDELDGVLNRFNPHVQSRFIEITGFLLMTDEDGPMVAEVKLRELALKVTTA